MITSGTLFCISDVISQNCTFILKKLSKKNNNLIGIEIEILLLQELFIWRLVIIFGMLNIFLH